VSIIIIKDNHAFLIQNPSSLASFPPRNTGGKGRNPIVTTPSSTSSPAQGLGTDFRQLPASRPRHFAYASWARNTSLKLPVFTLPMTLVRMQASCVTGMESQVERRASEPIGIHGSCPQHAAASPSDVSRNQIHVADSWADGSLPNPARHPRPQLAVT
jgi:hypothetical protein